jgi:DNA-directed RNA polymerase subunit H (RpoH/RPB5)
MSSRTQLPGPSDTYDIFRVMLTEVKILRDNGYLLGKYEYLTQATILESQARKLTKHSKFLPLSLSKVEAFESSSSDDSEDQELDYTEGLKYLKFSREHKVKPDDEWDLKEDFYLEHVVEENNLKDILRKNVKPRILSRTGGDVVTNLPVSSSILVIYETNPLAINLNAKCEDIIELSPAPSLKDKTKHFYYVRVIPVPQPYAVTVVLCDPDNVLGIVEDQMASKSKKLAKGKDKNIKHWIFITRTPTDTDRIIVPQGYEVRFQHYQHLYIDPLTHAKSPPSMKKLSYREAFDLKTLPAMKALKFPSISLEDPIAVRLSAVKGDVIEFHINNIFSEQTTSGIVWREVR